MSSELVTAEEALEIYQQWLTEAGQALINMQHGEFFIDQGNLA